MAHSTDEFHFDPPYDEILKGVLSFKDFADTEESLNRLENLRQRFESTSDKRGVAYCRKLALAGRRRAEMISKNKRVAPGKRLQKKEIALWFEVWLEIPELFRDWLKLRKNAEDFVKLQNNKTD